MRKYIEIVHFNSCLFYKIPILQAIYLQAFYSFFTNHLFTTFLQPILQATFFTSYLFYKLPFLLQATFTQFFPPRRWKFQLGTHAVRV